MFGVGLIYRRNYIQWLGQGFWKATLVANTRMAAGDDDREDNGWILRGGEENSGDITTYKRPNFFFFWEQSTCDKR